MEEFGIVDLKLTDSAFTNSPIPQLQAGPGFARASEQMHGFSGWVLGLFASPLGVVALAFLDSTLFFSLPFGIDAIVIILAARERSLWWAVPLLATAGSVAGAALTFWMGAKIGEKGLERHVPPKRLQQIQERLKNSGAIALAVLDLIPPPFPFTPFVLAAGALKVKRRLFFVALAVTRLIRFGLEAALALAYGPRIIAWLDSNVFKDIVFGCIILAVALTTLSIVRVVRATRPSRARTAAA
jgi:membrane protein YqaA with SNARE-associated domain